MFNPKWIYLLLLYEGQDSQVSESFRIARLKINHASVKNSDSLRATYFFTLERLLKMHFWPIVCHGPGLDVWWFCTFNNSIINPFEKIVARWPEIWYSYFLCKPIPPFVDTRSFMLWTFDVNLFQVLLLLCKSAIFACLLHYHLCISFVFSHVYLHKSYCKM